jgi:hypothetical protein
MHAIERRFVFFMRHGTSYYVCINFNYELLAYTKIRLAMNHV